MEKEDIGEEEKSESLSRESRSTYSLDEDDDDENENEVNDQPHHRVKRLEMRWLCGQFQTVKS